MNQRRKGLIINDIINSTNQCQKIQTKNLKNSISIIVKTMSETNL